MPRPGPRPYECVKRAWHSDRHQPVRGSIIQQIFRLVREAHSLSRRKNKEWQEKLPMVVLKAEEIIYSKANSEEEYADPETLWSRVNDAVDTIIRRDESAETGEFLPPCVEAALTLGCIPVRTSRSQRHSNPRTYLGPRIQEPSSMPPRTLDKTTTDELCFHLTSQDGSKLVSTANAGVPVDGSNYQATENTNILVASHGYQFSHNLQMRYKSLRGQEATASSNLGSIYPLYYGANNHTELFQTNPSPIIVGMPITLSVSNQGKMGRIQNLFPRSHTNLVSEGPGQASSRDFCEEAPNKTCDLSLRLGLPPDPCARFQKSSCQEDSGYSSFEKGRSSEVDPGRYKEFCFFPEKTKTDASESDSNQWFPNSELRVSKQKTQSGDDP